MKCAGIDLGSRTVKVVLLEDGQMLAARKQENSFDPLNVAADLLHGLTYDVITATGYGRHLFQKFAPCAVISEISAFALGARYLFPSCQAILDIGGQDTKAIALDAAGRIRKFEMNDKCAAGTGRFLEIMALALGYTLPEFAAVAAAATQTEKINSMCTVFAESEIISMVARGVPREALARGIHQTVASRSAAMLQKVTLATDVVFVGGVAINPAMRAILAHTLRFPVHTPADPQIIGALGCALHGGR